MDSLIDAPKRLFSSSVQQSPKPTNWDSFLQLQKQTAIPDDFLGKVERQQPYFCKDPFLEWDEHS